MSLFASWTGIVCVILVAEGRASNYLFGAINSAIYLILAMNATFYGEVLTTVYFFVMQPIGLYAWLSNRINDQGKVEKSQLDKLVECLLSSTPSSDPNAGKNYDEYDLLPWSYL